MAACTHRFIAHCSLALGLALTGCPGDSTSGATDTVSDSTVDVATDADAGPADASDDGGGADAADASPSDADTTDAADAPQDTTTPAPPLIIERLGARIHGPIIALSRTDRTLWIGTTGRPDPLDQDTIRAGLFRVELDSGAVKHYEDELPQGPHYDYTAPGQVGPVPTAGVQRDGDRHIAVAFDGLLTIDAVGVTPFPLTVADAPVIPIALAIARDGLRPVAWLTSDAGLIRLNEDDLSVETVIGTDTLGVAGSFGSLAVDPDTGTVFAAFYPDDGGASRIVRADVAGTVTTFTPGVDGGAAGRVGDLAWSATDGGVYAAIGAWSATGGGVLFWDGATTSSMLVDEGDLADAAIGERAAFGAAALAIDDANRVLVVGGRLQTSFTGTKGGGLAFVDLDAPARRVGVGNADVPAVAVHVAALALDPTQGRVYVSLLGQCSELRLRHHGVYAVSFADDDGRVRLERPMLSGVRAVLRDGDATLLALRDDHLGIACDGTPVQSGLVDVRADGVGAFHPLKTVDGTGISQNAGVTAIAGASLSDVALATWRDGFYAGNAATGTGTARNPTLDYGVSLFIEDITLVGAAGAVRDLWIAGRTSHQNGDPPQLADRGPRGAARITLEANGKLGPHTHFVSVSEDAQDVTGLPSSDVRAVLPAPDGGVYLACATEVLEQSPYDRAEEPVFMDADGPRLGGVAKVVGDAVTIVATSADAPDPRALAFDPAGDVVIADATRGLLVARAAGVIAYETPPPALPGAIPRTLWISADGDIALGSDRGVSLRYAGRTRVIEGVGHVWTVHADGDTLLIGTDEGLVRVRSEATPVPAPWPARGAARWPPFSPQ